ncbi:MAG: DUF2975 domain-containing protein [Lachnospiraceae bacterium]|nr:DUF2975 domain-containing protein [Lachnospiraceae bacterium]
MDKKAKKRVRLMQISAIISVAIILILGARTKDFVRAVLSDGDNFEVRLEEDTDVTNHQQVYRLYKNNSYMGDIDYNRYSLLDKIGRTDIRYCVLIEEAKALTYSVLLGAMLIIAIVIAASSIDGTPFTKKNANRIRWIGVLQFGLAIVPGLVGFLMSFFRFEYTSLSFSVTQFYMFAIGVAIMILAQVFDHGVQLQEDVDSIA